MIMNTPQIQDFAGKRIHMIGIGGSSMSGLAQMLQHLGYQVTGSDQNDGYLMNDVRQAGVKVTIGHRAGVCRVRHAFGGCGEGQGHRRWLVR